MQNNRIQLHLLRKTACYDQKLGMSYYRSFYQMLFEKFLLTSVITVLIFGALCEAQILLLHTSVTSLLFAHFTRTRHTLKL